jgi:HPr kinase/phosphorylase
VVTKGLTAPPELLAAAEQSGVPVLTTPLQSTEFIKQLSAFLDQRLALRTLLHAVLLDVFGLGVLIMGQSGIGKSECALELVDRGHRAGGGRRGRADAHGGRPGGVVRPT